MRLLALLVTLCLATPLTLTAAPPTEHSPLLASADREARRLAASVTQDRPADPQNPTDRSWISRHPALFGTLVGAGAGTVMSLVMENEMFCSGGDEDCFFHGGSRALVGAGIGAGVGALVGWIAGAARSDGKSPDRQIIRSPHRQIASSPNS